MAKKMICLLLCLLLCAGCAKASVAPPQSLAAPEASTPQEPIPDTTPMVASADRIYRLFAFEKIFSFSSDGRLLTKEEAYTPLYAVDTRKAQYRMLVREEDTGKDDEYDQPIVEQYSALYTTDGKLLCDWEKTTYRPAMGELVIRQDKRSMWFNPTTLSENYQTALWNPITKETVIDGVDSVESMGNGSFLVSDVFGRVLGRIDQDGTMLSGFPVVGDYFYPSSKNGFISAETRNPYAESKRKDQNQILLDQDFNVLLEKPSLNLGFVGLRGPYLSYQDGDIHGILSIPDLKECFQTTDPDTGIEYFDGERVILRNGDPGEWQSWLTDLEGTALTEPLDMLWPLDQYATLEGQSPSQNFLAVLGGQGMLLDRDGKVLASATFPQLDNVSALTDGLYSYQIKSADNDYSSYRTGLLGADFKVLLPAETYNDITPLYRYEGYTAYPTGLLTANRMLPQGIQVTDLLDSSGKVVLSNISQMGDAGEDRIVIRRGFSVGLIDYQGNWIAKHSVYSELSDD